MTEEGEIDQTRKEVAPGADLKRACTNTFERFVKRDKQGKPAAAIAYAVVREDVSHLYGMTEPFIKATPIRIVNSDKNPNPLIELLELNTEGPPNPKKASDATASTISFQDGEDGTTTPILTPVGSSYQPPQEPKPLNPEVIKRWVTLLEKAESYNPEKQYVEGGELKSLGPLQRRNMRPFRE